VPVVYAVPDAKPRPPADALVTLCPKPAIVWSLPEL
jgi:hypothetical protein